jgi:hypothetical protein
MYELIGAVAVRLGKPKAARCGGFDIELNQYRRLVAKCPTCRSAVLFLSVLGDRLIA